MTDTDITPAEKIKFCSEHMGIAYGPDHFFSKLINSLMIRIEADLVIELSQKQMKLINSCYKSLRNQVEFDKQLALEESEGQA